ncbi:choline kinase alpha-like [Oppia nitens]|uniref:choline kinase alpha-like n=1 Tax=Oppia nitens TaxID=1686743 RepID=UPI0023DC3FAB|nr:choline kinase alpha-like [Oppia nitens]
MDFSKITEITDEDRSKLHDLCKSYLSDKWLDVKTDELIIKPIAAGFVNKIYYCALPDNVDQTAKVMVRYENEEISKMAGINPVSTLSIALVLSLSNISPDILGAFPGGTIIQYIESRYWEKKDDFNDKSVAQLAQKLAKLHSTTTPIAKQPRNLKEMYEKFVTQEFKDEIRKGIISKQAVDSNLKTFQEVDVLDEYIWLLDLVTKQKSPIVFSHNDFNRRNILVKDTIVNNNQELEIYLIDFDWSCYGMRGIDLGQYFCGWAQVETDFGDGPIPTDQQMSVFIDAYMAEMSQLVGNDYLKQAVNSREKVIKEAKIFTLYAYMKDVMYLVFSTIQSKSTDNLPKAEVRFNMFMNLKKQILKEYNNIN